MAVLRNKKGFTRKRDWVQIMASLTYKELFQKIACDCLIIFEDDFSLDNNDLKNAILFNLLRMNRRDRDAFMEQVKEVSTNTYGKLYSLCQYADENFANIKQWDDIVRNALHDTLRAMASNEQSTYEEVISLCEGISLQEIKKISEVAKQYGLGIVYPSDYEALFDEYVWGSDIYPSVHIYTDFSDDDKNRLSQDFALLQDDNSIVCIVDVNLHGDDMAEAILSHINEQNITKRKNILGTVYSSKSSFECVDNLLYFEFTSKSAGNSLKGPLARSCYSYYLYSLKISTLNRIEKAFDTMIKDRYLGQYLATKANIEGESEYDVINDWFRLLCRPTKDSEESIIKLVKSARVINAINDMDDNDFDYDPTLEIYNTFEAFDYNVNAFLQPPTVGDVYLIDEDKYYILIGQDCDMAWRGNGKPPRNELYELLPIKIYPQNTLDKKWINDQKEVKICNFKKDISDTANYICSIDYQHREYVSREILDICSYNSDGRCDLWIEKDLSPEQLDIIPQFLVSYFDKLKIHYRQLLKIKNTLPTEFECVVDSSLSGRVVGFSKMKVEGADKKCIISFPITRVCRLSHEYVFYLYRLFLDYRGRQPFKTINLVGQSNLTLPLYKDDIDTGKCITLLCLIMPNRSNITKMPWIIENDNVKEILDVAEASFKDGNYNNRLVLNDNNMKFQVNVGGRTKNMKLTKRKDKLIINIS